MVKITFIWANNALKLLFVVKKQIEWAIFLLLANPDYESRNSI